MAYLELLLRCVTQRGLLRAVLHFLFAYEYDGIRVIDVLLKRLEGTLQVRQSTHHHDHQPINAPTAGALAFQRNGP
jgi:hypothetical protein